MAHWCMLQGRGALEMCWVKDARQRSLIRDAQNRGIIELEADEEFGRKGECLLSGNRVFFVAWWAVFWRQAGTHLSSQEEVSLAMSSKPTLATESWWEGGWENREEGREREKWEIWNQNAYVVAGSCSKDHWILYLRGWAVWFMSFI